MHSPDAPSTLKCLVLLNAPQDGLCFKDEPCSGQCISLLFIRAQSAELAGSNSGPVESPHPSVLVVNTPQGLAAELSSIAGNCE